MNERLKKILDTVKAFAAKFSKKTIIIFFSVTAAVIVMAIVITSILNRPKYVVLYPDLSTSEAQEVASAISERNIEYKDENGTIYVPEDQEASLRMDLSNAGHPYSTYNYDFFLNNVDVMTTDAERKILEKYQLSQRLESVISTLNCVDRASVIIDVADQDDYVISSKNDKKSTASVTLALKDGQELSNTQVSGIKNLVSKSVPNLETEDVSIIDNATGVELGSSTNTGIDKSTFKMSLQTQYEAEIQKKIYDLLSKIFGGDDKVQVAAKCNIDVDQGIKEITTYQPSEDNKGVTQHEEHTTTTTGGDANASGTPGTDSNTGTTTYSEVTSDDNTIYLDNNYSYDYLVSQIKEQINKDSAELVDMTISVAIDEEGISEEKKQDVAKLVANSSGVSEDKVFVYTGSFNKTTPNEPTVNDDVDTPIIPIKWIVIGIASIVGLLILSIIALIITKALKRGKSKKANKKVSTTQQEVVNKTNVLDDPELEKFQIGKIEPVTESKAQVLKNEIQDFTSDNPEIAAQLVRTWLTGGEDDDK